VVFLVAFGFTKGNRDMTENLLEVKVAFLLVN